MKIKKNITDPLVDAIRETLTQEGIEFYEEGHPLNLHHMDFYLPQFDLYVEVKGGHTDRISEQMSRHPNVLVVQGVKTTAFFVGLLKGFNP